ncbi:UDP-3-O-acyl-N-acetylglucosamine deacetylase [Methylobacterium sp. NEAU 140]|uniref:UDP-3-O-acyl-N-acetylglucosamine deacetylase n=1 Tax=Methylobacterium sp. NEAU 140 TaxID=3064945 RepID=UPI002733C655|nr:UDP-3-O-acyl-N-acetylglucosamine deacetylase [Methylobacterium sp. NEAU 140]MDP4024820.1 UDP-3-O-acyl-N-acetylglucosamine deacetylase [Methylobacterium sp. NEAU 140]
MHPTVAVPAEISPPIGSRRSQATLAAAFARAGRGLHTGGRAHVRVSPAPADHGIVFRRRLEDGRVADVPGLWRYRESQPLCTALRRDGVLVRTVEHLMASLRALAIDNALVEIDAEELPIFDGSATPWCAAILAAGRVEQAAACRTLRVTRTVAVCDGRRTLRIEPGPGLHVAGHVELSYFGRIDWAGAITPESFVGEIAPARSFGRFFRAMAGRVYGFAARKPFLQGCSPHSAALLVRGHVIGGLRVPGEPVRHRILDVIGDLALVGHPVEGRITAAHTGHELNHALVAALMADPAAWELA